MTYRERDIIWSVPDRRRRGDAGGMPGAVDVLTVAYPAGTEVPEHQHARHQLIYAQSGLMSVMSPRGRWIVPSTRAIWMPAGTPHSSRCIDDVAQRNLYIDPSAAPDLPADVAAVEVGPLLRELILAAGKIRQPYAEDSRDQRVMRLILDELRTLPVLPLHLPRPRDARILRICDHIVRHPHDTSTLADGEQNVGTTRKTIQRVFTRELDMTFGQWRQRARLLCGLERLAAGAPVIAVAMELGYESPSAFAAMFRRHFGVSPSQFFAR